jgi:hypothetical protein
MQQTTVSAILAQLDELIGQYELMKEASEYNDLSDIDQGIASEFITSGLDAIVRISGSDSQYSIQCKNHIDKLAFYQLRQAIHPIGGAIKGLRHAVAAGYLTSVEELIHADLFSDFLEMAEHLLEQGYKDPAAVLIGGVLEEHLRKLAQKTGIDIEFTDSSGRQRPKKADGLNADLANNGVYSKLDLKNVTAWLDLRNKAAHGKYLDYTQEQVVLLLQSVRDFVTRYQA